MDDFTTHSRASYLGPIYARMKLRVFASGHQSDSIWRNLVGWTSFSILNMIWYLCFRSVQIFVPSQWKQGDLFVSEYLLVTSLSTHLSFLNTYIYRLLQNERFIFRNSFLNPTLKNFCSWPALTAIRKSSIWNVRLGHIFGFINGSLITSLILLVHSTLTSSLLSMLI